MENNSTTKQLKQVLGFGDLLGAAIGTIIGAGIMTLLGATIAMTGRSVPFSFLIAAGITICQFLPMILVSGTVRLRGGQYTMVAMLAGNRYAGAFSIIHIFSQVAIAMYPLAFASYFVSLFGFGNEKVIALIVLTIFFLLNCFGIDKFAKFQNVIVAMLIVALGIFVAFGAGKVAPGYFEPESFIPNGIPGLFKAGGLLTFAVAGAYTTVNLSAEAKNPTRDIPLVMIVPTLIVSVLYGVVSVIAAGVLPVEQVANQNLTVVADVIFPRSLYVFFVVCGAGFAIISTLNAQFAWASKPIMQACDDGWFPAGLAKLSRWKTPYIILALLYGIAVICIVADLDISVLGNVFLIGMSAVNLIINAFAWKMPTLCPKEWEHSKFKVGPGIVRLFTVLGVVSSLLNIYLNAISLSPVMLAINIVVIVGAVVFGTLRDKHARVDTSYEEA